MLFAVGGGKGLQNPLETGTAVLVVRWEIRSAKERAPIGSQKGSERPSSLATYSLDGSLVSTVDVGTLVAVYLNRNIILVNQFCDLRILVGLTIHHVAPMAPDRPYVEQHRLVLALGLIESVGAPLMPIYGLMHRRSQI